MLALTRRNFIVSSAYLTALFSSHRIFSQTSNLTDLTINDASALIRTGYISPVELTNAYLNRITDLNPQLNAFITVTEDQALDTAREMEEEISNGQWRGPLHGIPVALKDNIDMAGTLTTAASAVFANRTPSEDAEVVRRLKKAGAIILGKLNMHEFAAGGTSDVSYFGPVHNPWDTNRIPGGSSGGSAAAVSGKLTPVTIGTDTGGSIRQPASFTGIVGLKPTYGSCSRYGIVAFASSLDQAGPMTQNVKDCALLQEVMSSYDTKDSTSIDFKRNLLSKNLTNNIKGKKIGIPKEYRVDGMPKEIDDLWQKGIEYVKDCGAETIDISLPHTSYALPAYYIVAPAEASSNLARYDGVKYGFRVDGENLIDMYEKTRSEGFGDEVKRRIMIGTYVLSSGYYDAYYLKAQKARTVIKEDFERIFSNYDVVLSPTTPSPAFKLGEKTEDPTEMYLSDIATIPANMAGIFEHLKEAALTMQQGGGLGDVIDHHLNLIGFHPQQQLLLDSDVCTDCGFSKCA